MKRLDPRAVPPCLNFVECEPTPFSKQLGHVKSKSKQGQVKKIISNKLLHFCGLFKFFNCYYENYNVYRGYYTVARRYDFIFGWQTIFYERAQRVVKYCFCHEKIKFISSSRRVMFFLLHRQKHIDKIIEGNYRNYVIDKLTCENMENK